MADVGRHYRSFANKERAEQWMTELKETENVHDVHLENRFSNPVDFNEMMSEAIRAGNIPAVIEIDHSRGVIWIHDATQGITAIRLCGLQGRIKLPLDIALTATMYMQEVEIPSGDLRGSE